MIWLVERGKTIMLRMRHAFWCDVLTYLPNDKVKFSYLEFWQKQELEAINFHYLSLHENHSCQASESAVRLFCTTWNNRKTLNLTQSLILMWRFRCSCLRSFLNSLFWCEARCTVVILEQGFPKMLLARLLTDAIQSKLCRVGDTSRRFQFTTLEIL